MLLLSPSVFLASNSGIRLAKLSQAVLRNRFQFSHELSIMATAAYRVYTSTFSQNQREMPVPHAFTRKFLSYCIA